jgi:hypothetical protein
MGPQTRFPPLTYGPIDLKKDKMFVAPNDDSRRNRRIVSMYFNEKWKERLEVMALKQNISAVCEVVRISLMDLTLDNCDLRD